LPFRKGPAVTPFEYLLSLAAIVLGLAIADLSSSVHRLLAAGARVRWDWLAPMAALVVFLKIVTQWWSWFAAQQIASGLTFEMFLAVLASAVLLFLLAATALPDDFGDRPVDLRAHYASVSRRYWLLFVAQWLLATVANLWAQVAVGKAHVDLVSPAWLVPLVAVSAAFTKNRWWHTAILAGFVVFYTGQLLGHSLTR
jgi:hypothetical protein